MDINSFWNDVLSKNRKSLPHYFCSDAAIRWHCSNEQFTVLEYITANCEYPDEWNGEIERVEESENKVVLVGRVYPKDQNVSFHVVSFLKLEKDKICEMDEYWADDGDAPSWRKKMNLGKPIR